MNKELYYHPSAVKDAQTITKNFERESHDLADKFWADLTSALLEIKKILERHLDETTGKRRYNLKKFPFHILFEERLDGIKILVINHNSRKATYGSRRK